MSEPAAHHDTDSLAAALARHAIEISADQQAVLQQYCQKLWDWNEKLNLTRHTSYEKFVTRDVIDSLALSRHLEANEDVLDVGTGGGVPGVILAITRPDISVTLCESIAKKAKAVEDIILKLPISCRVLHARAENLLDRGYTFDTLVARGVARLDKLLSWFNPYWGSMRRLLLIKGPAWVEERKACRERRLIQHLELRKLETYRTPGTEAESVVLQLQPKRAKPGGRPP